MNRFEAYNKWADRAHMRTGWEVSASVETIRDEPPGAEYAHYTTGRITLSASGPEGSDSGWRISYTANPDADFAPFDKLMTMAEEAFYGQTQ